MGELLKGLQRAQHSEAALWGLGTWERKFTKRNPLHLLFALLLSSRSDFNGYLFPACFIEWLLKKPSLLKIIKNDVSIGREHFHKQGM